MHAVSATSDRSYLASPQLDFPPVRSTKRDVPIPVSGLDLRPSDKPFPAPPKTPAKYPKPE
eukprot:scaffold310_cov335-Pavlova_lutheri.AAC.31